MIEHFFKCRTCKVVYTDFDGYFKHKKKAATHIGVEVVDVDIEINGSSSPT